MISSTQLIEIQNRIENAAPEQLRQDTAALVAEVAQLHKRLADFTAQVTQSLATMESNSVLLMNENDRLRAVEKSTYFERDACIGLIAQLSMALGHNAGTCRAEVTQENMDGTVSNQIQNRVVVDLPGGQVSWDFMDSEKHLFETLPAYVQPLEATSVHEVYARVMNPGIGATAN